MSNIEKIVEIPLGKDLQYTGMTVHKLAPNQVLEETLAKDVEACVVILSGDAQAKINDVDYEINGNRTTVFDD